MATNACSKKKIIFARNSFPYKGGSSTILYMLFESIQRYLPNAEFWNFITKSDKDIGDKYYGPFWFNPKGLANVKTFFINENRTIKASLKKLDPQVILSKSRLSTRLLKQLYPKVNLWHLTSTCGVIKNAIINDQCYSMQDAISQLRDNKFSRAYNSEEHTAIRYADKILFHTEMMKLWYYNLYPEFIEKMERMIFWDYPIVRRHIRENDDLSDRWKKRPIDLLFIASNWNRPEKNFPFLKELCKHFRQKKIVVIGFLPSQLSHGVICYNAMSYSDVVQTMRNTKVVVVPSRYDEAPNIVFEGALGGCNIVCSRNCGNYRLVPKELLAEFKLSDFVTKIRNALKQKYKLNQKYFIKDDLIEWILEQMV